MIVPEADRSVTSEIAPALISIPLIVSSVNVVITPVEDTWNAFPVPDVRVPEMSKFPVTSVFSARLMFPVVFPPMVRVFKSVVPIDAFVESRAILPERDAVWLPLAKLLPRIAKVAEDVACPPIRRSTVELFEYNAPRFCPQNASEVPAGQDCHEGADAPERRQRF